MKNIILFSLIMMSYELALAQTCTLTNQIEINTGLDPVSGLVQAAGAADFNWIIDNANNVPGAVNNSPAIVTNPANATFAFNPGAQWISFANNNAYVTNNSTVGYYLMTMKFPFRLCSSDSVAFDLNFAFDNYISNVKLNGVPIGFAQAPNLAAANYQTFSSLAYNTFLLQGTHIIEFDVQNYNVSGALNPHLFCAYGTISSINNSIVALVNPSNCPCLPDSITAAFNSTNPNICDSTIFQFSDLSIATNSNIVSWAWDFGDGNTSALQNPLHNYTIAGPFNVTLIVTSNTGKSDTFSQTITAIANYPTIQASASSASVCLGDPITLTATGGLSYNWSNGIQNGIQFVPNSSATYTVIGTDANGCTGTSNVSITVINPLIINLNNNPPIICIGDTSTISASGALSFTWSPTMNTTINGINNFAAYPTQSTTYTVTGTDANGCTGTATTLVEVVDKIEVVASKSNDIECGMAQIQLSATGASLYTWSPAATLSNPNAALTNASPNQQTTYYVTGSTGSCQDTDSITVYFYNNTEGSIFIPNAFTPNGDGNNDCFGIKHNAKFKSYYFAIYNRWGERVFESDSPQYCWDGNYRTKPSEGGTYFYFLRAESNCGTIFKKGDVVLIR